jgi:SAM-dependent methyltransferase
MLAYFGDEWDRYGVEPARAAVEIAERRGVKVLADTLDNLGPDVAPFDAVLAIDVVEHLVEPVPFFRRISELLKPGGVFVLLTGNTSALAWRLQGSMFWYCSLPEHVSFYDRRSLDELGRRSGLVRVDFHELSHKRLPVTRWASDMFKSTVYVAGRATGGFGIKPLRRIFVERRGPSIMTAKDHLLCVLRKE